MTLFPSISSTTQLCAVMGNPIAHSLSPAIHNAAFHDLGLDYVFLAFHVTDVKNAMNALRALGQFRGLSVTIPHKSAVIEHLDRIDELARIAGSINTVVNNKGELYGTSTDGAGALRALQEGGAPLNRSNILILGSGGASRGIAFALLDQFRPASLTLTDHLPETRDNLIQALGNHFDTPLHATQRAPQEYDLIINTTPVGMAPYSDQSPLPVDSFRAGQTLFDVVYTPLKTQLLRDAEAAGAKIVTGAEMFLHQAALQFELYTGHTPSLEVMRRTLMKELGDE
jgi:shikimate dehydrogenase